MTRTTVRLPEDLLKLAQAHARRTGRTFTQLLEQAVRSELAHHATRAHVAERSPVYATHTDADRDSTNTDSSNGDAPNAEPRVHTAEQRERSANQLLQQVQELQAFLRALPDLDPRPADEILGYNAEGLTE